MRLGSRLAGQSPLKTGGPSAGKAQEIPLWKEPGTVDEHRQLVTLQADEGMTWTEWVDSEYNTLGLYVEDNSVKIAADRCLRTGSNSGNILANDAIVGNNTYLIYMP